MTEEVGGVTTLLSGEPLSGSVRFPPNFLQAHQEAHPPKGEFIWEGESPAEPTGLLPLTFQLPRFCFKVSINSEPQNGEVGANLP